MDAGRNQAPSTSDRVHSIDFSKGVLVLLMVVYHALNYLQLGSLPHDYIGFVPASFIMITGFLVAIVYLPRRAGRFKIIATRLIVRALKLVALFTALNIGARLVWSENHYGTDLSVASFIDNWVAIYFTGRGSGIAFDVLLPIGYTLLVCVPFAFQAVGYWAVRSLAIVLFVSCTLLDLLGYSVSTLNLISAGIIGAAIGSLGLASVDREVRSMRTLILAATIYIIILVVRIDNYPAQILITMTWLIFLYRIAHSIPSSSWASQQFSLLGRYSLLAYIVQILYLQWTNVIVLAASSSPVLHALVLSLIIASLTWATTVVVESLRTRFRMMDRLYNIVLS